MVRVQYGVRYGRGTVHRVRYGGYRYGTGGVRVRYGGVRYGTGTVRVLYEGIQYRVLCRYSTYTICGMITIRI